MGNEDACGGFRVGKPPKHAQASAPAGCEGWRVRGGEAAMGVGDGEGVPVEGGEGETPSAGGRARAREAGGRGGEVTTAEKVGTS
eukprot:6212333-Pleurochrysis_carterae.AAC.5